MSERLSQPNLPIDPELRHQEAWQEAMANPDFANRLTQLVSITQESAAGVEGVDWAGDQTEMTYRWQHAIAYTQQFSWVSERNDRNVDAAKLDSALQLIETMVKPDELSADTMLHGWHPAGLGFVTVKSGFGWLYDKGGWDELSANWLLRVDLRDFTRTEDPLPDTYEGYKALSRRDQENIPKVIMEQSKRKIYGSYEWGGAPHGYADGWHAFGQMNKLNEYHKFDKHGVPDVELTYEDIADYLADLVAYRKTKDPDYGSFPPIYQYMNDELASSVYSITEYFLHMYSLGDEPAINNDTLLNAHGYSQETLDGLVQHGVLVKNGLEVEMDGQEYDRYILGPKWEGVWLDSLVFETMKNRKS